MDQLALFDRKQIRVKPIKYNKSMIGKRFTRLTVLDFHSRSPKTKWRCICDCGKIVTVTQSNLVGGNTKSCGCINDELKKERNENKKFDLTGIKYNKLTGIKEIGKDGRGETTWLFKCDCGRECVKIARYVRGGVLKSCGICKEIRKHPVKLKRRDMKQYAQDLYCWYADGMSIRDIAREQGYACGGSITDMFNNYVDGYKLESKKRRDNSTNLSRSKLFRHEKDFQEFCVSKINLKTKVMGENDRSITGHEIDILTDTHCYELKIDTRRKNIYTALGQLIANKPYGLVPVLLIPHDTHIKKQLMKLLEDNGIEIQTELDL